jgi:putative colanic acid biosynthesis acetyltransferase WcaF
MKRFAKYLLNYIFNEIVTHIPIRILRISFLRLFNKKIHKKTLILLHAKILNFWKISIEEGVVINQYCLLDCRVNNISIGKHSDIGPFTRIWTLGHDPNSPTHNVYGGSVIIGHHVWIAAGATILPGVTLSNGTVVGASSVVHKSTEMNDVVAGNPAVFRRKRVNDLTYKILWDPIFQ